MLCIVRTQKCSAHQKVKSQDHPIKNTRHSKSRKNMAHDQQKQPVKTSQEMTQIIDKDIETVTVTAFHVFRKLEKD